MCKIVNFPTNRIQNSNGYNNLVALFEVCDTVGSCNFYLEAVENLFQNGNITEKELYTLRRIGRQKRLTLATPEQEPQKADNPGTYTYTPEMGQKKPEGCQMEASRAICTTIRKTAGTITRLQTWLLKNSKRNTLLQWNTVWIKPKRSSERQPRDGLPALMMADQ